MRDLTPYAPVRVALSGIWRIIFGLLLAVPAGALIWIGPRGERSFRWDEIKQLVHFTREVNGIPMAAELRIHLQDGAIVELERCWFSANTRTIQERLSALSSAERRA